MAFKEIPDRYLGTIIHFLMNFHNDTSEFNRPHIRKSFESCYMVFIFLYAILMIAGVVANVLMIRKIVQQRHQCLIIHKCLASNALNDIFKCIVVLPVALCTILFQNWIYGSFFCDLFPMLQDVPFHATMLTFLLIAFDRYRQILYPIKPRISFGFSIVCVWLFSIFAVLPYAVYTRYLDLEVYFGEQFKDTGICAINIEDNIEEYIRGLFIIMYVMPLALIAFLHVKASEEIKTKQMMTIHEMSAANKRKTASLTSVIPQDSANSSKRPSSTVMLSVSTEFVSNPCSSRSCKESTFHISTTVESQEDHTVWAREQQIQNFLSSTVMAYAACLLPLNLVRLLKHIMYETNDNSFHFDITFVIVVMIAFIPSITTPLIYRSYQFDNAKTRQNANHYLRLDRSSDVSLSVYESIRKFPKTKKTVSVESTQLSNTPELQ